LFNNLKQFGLAVRVWALDNNDSNPPNVLSMSNELATPKILVCPAETNRPVAANWSSFTMVNCSYEFLVPDEKDADREPQRVSVRCPIHGILGYAMAVFKAAWKGAFRLAVERGWKSLLRSPGVA